jgi:hypothetical protein
MYGDNFSNQCRFLTISYIVIFFPFTITLIVVLLIVIFSKIYNQNTVFVTSSAGICCILEICCWAYFLSSIPENTESSLNIIIPIILVGVSLGIGLLLNIIFYFLNNRKIK